MKKKIPNRVVSENQTKIALNKWVNGYFSRALKIGKQKNISQASLKKLEKELEKLKSEKIAKFLVKSTSKEYDKLLKEALATITLDVSKTLADINLSPRIEYGTSLIKDLGDVAHRRTIEIFERAALNSEVNIAQELRGVLKATKSRSRLIARDQAASIHSEINRTRMGQLHQDVYKWSTSNDERVRDEHYKLNGLTFTIAKPSSEGHPGDPIQCRCTYEWQINVEAIINGISASKVLSKIKIPDINKKIAGGKILTAKENKFLSVLKGSIMKVDDPLYRGASLARNEAIPKVGSKFGLDTIASATTDLDRAKKFDKRGMVIKFENKQASPSGLISDKDPTDFLFPAGVKGVVKSVTKLENNVTLVTVR